MERVHLLTIEREHLDEREVSVHATYESAYAKLLEFVKDEVDLLDVMGSLDDESPCTPEEYVEEYGSQDLIYSYFDKAEHDFYTLKVVGVENLTSKEYHKEGALWM